MEQVGKSQSDEPTYTFSLSYTKISVFGSTSTFLAEMCLVTTKISIADILTLLN